MNYKLILKLLLLSFIGCISCSQTKNKPNVVIIYTDDVGFGDVGSYGSKLIPTPNIDKLAESGIQFMDAHSAAATCSPSRYSLLTGELAFRNPNAAILQGDAKMLIEPDQYTLANLFQDAGYKTGIVGKWHLGLGNGKIDWNKEILGTPNSLGFDYSYIIPATNDRVPCVYLENGKVVNLSSEDPLTVSYWKRIPDNVEGTNYPDAIKNPEAVTLYKGDRQHSCSVINGVGRIGYMKGGKSAVWSDENMAIDLLEQAKSFIKSNKKDPFLLCFTTSDIHAPRIPHQKFRGSTTLGYRGDNMVQLDWVVGEVMNTLKELKMEKNTIVIFSSDNGPVYEDGGYKDGCVDMLEEVDRGHDASGQYTGGKYRITEGGTRVPFIISWPNKINPGISNALISQTDLLASFSQLLDVKLPNNSATDSRMLWKTLIGEDKKGADIIIEEATGLKPGLAIRQGSWKLIELHPEHTWGKPFSERKIVGYSLFNLAFDPKEMNDLNKIEIEKSKELMLLLKHYKSNNLNDI
ncbi:arylsulfatase [Flammeovirga sp. MY04]|uniref:sulfatase family protein n=1 Tax=Flammeovirga sp. MY04 TaxID=1191459 RepID=UPI0008064426|nr:arylsulfatase [Flammeovirga sp. MY04]ANQ51646.1 arylsulfatase [Flammeovirga sp. MY04]